MKSSEEFGVHVALLIDSLIEFVKVLTKMILGSARRIISYALTLSCKVGGLMDLFIVS